MTTLTHRLEAAITDLLDAAASIADPLERARALDAVGQAIPDVAARIRRERAAAIREAMSTQSAVFVASELGVSRSRLYKILE